MTLILACVSETLARFCAEVTPATVNAARVAMMATTTSNSINVKPEREEFWQEIGEVFMESVGENRFKIPNNHRTLAGYCIYNVKSTIEL